VSPHRAVTSRTRAHRGSARPQLARRRMRA
jgi:hypothetical protein